MKVERLGLTFAPGDKVMLAENDYDRETYNGDLGFVLRIDAPPHVNVALATEGSRRLWPLSVLNERR